MTSHTGSVHNGERGLRVPDSLVRNLHEGSGLPDHATDAAGILAGLHPIRGSPGEDHREADAQLVPADR